MTIHDGPEVGHGVADDVVLTAGEQLVRTILPPRIEQSVHPLEIESKFLSKNARWVPMCLNALQPMATPPGDPRMQPWQMSLPGRRQAAIDRLRGIRNADK